MDEKGTVQTYLGKVTQIIDPSNFWMHIGTDESLAEFLQVEINMEHYGQTMSSSVENIDEIAMGQLVLVDCTESGRMWRRGLVSRLDRVTEKADILYIDYGDTELVNLDRLCVNFPEEYSSFPAQAVKCSLAGITSIARNWTSRATKEFHDIVQNEIFQTVVLQLQQPGNFKVSLYTNHGDDGRAVSHILLDKELGMPTDDDVPEFFVDAPKHCSPDGLYPGGEYSMWGTPTTWEGETEEEAWPESNLAGSSSQTAEDNTDEDSWPKAIGAYNSSGAEAESQESDDGDDEADANGNSDVSDEEGEGMAPIQMIPEFDFDKIQKTRDTSKHKLEEKKQIQKHIELEAENLKLKEDMKEQADLTAAAGSGRHAILQYSSDEEENKPVFSGKFLDSQSTGEIYNTNQPNEDFCGDNGDKENKPPPIVVEGKKKQREVYEVPPRFKKKAASTETNEQGPKIYHEDAPRLQTSKTFTSKENQPEDSRYTPVHWSSEKQTFPNLRSGENVLDTKSSNRTQNKNVVLEPLRMPDSPRFGNDVEDVHVLGYSSDEERKDVGAMALESIAALEQNSPSKVDFHRVLNQIFGGINKEDWDVTAAKLRRLFATDLFMYLDTEQLQDVINILLNRAVRYYGEIHDCLLEIIELLNVTQDFSECIVVGIKKLHDMYIKVAIRGTPFHTQCSKIMGHLFNLSLFWTESGIAVQRCILNLVERWVYFNKKGTQTGQEELEQIYLESFKTIWVIIRDVLKQRFQENLSSIQWECKDKLFAANISRSIKEQLLDMYINCFILPSDKFTVTAACQTNSLQFHAHATCQTDPVELSTNNTSQTHPHHTDTGMQFVQTPENTVQGIGHKLVNDSLTLMTPSSFETSLKTPLSTVNSRSTPPSVASTDNSVYLTPEQSPFLAEFPPLNQSSNAKGDSVSEAAMVVRKSWADLIGSQENVPNVCSNHSSGENLPNISGMKQDRLSPYETGQKIPEKTDEQNEGVQPLSAGESVTAIGKWKEGHSKETKKNPQEVTGVKKKDSHKGHKKGSVPLLRYGLATSKQGQTVDDRGHSVDSAASESGANKKLDLKSIMMDFMQSDSDKHSGAKDDVHLVSGDRVEKKKKQTSHSSKKPIDWWSVGVDDDVSDECDDIIDLGWNNHRPDDRDVVLAEVQPPISSENGATYTSETGNLISNSGQSHDLNPADGNDDKDWETVDSEEDEKIVADILKKSKDNIRPCPVKPVQHDAPKWRPGRRKCTACGEESHTVYECPQKDKQFFF